MWHLDNRTPYAADYTWGRDKEGVHEWIVAVKATYHIQPDGALILAEEQLPPLLAPEYHGEPGASSLRYDADLISPKPATDIVLVGSAHAPGGRPSTEFWVALRIGRQSKQLRVVGDRFWRQGIFGLTATSPRPVAQVPLVYERAYGGFDQSDPDPTRQRMDARNPVGCGLVVEEGRPLPNFEPADGNLEKAGPAGFGPLDSFWSPRRELGGTYDERWQAGRYPLLPSDWDPRTLQCAPLDQQVNRPLRGEVIELTNLTPSGYLRFSLPALSLRLRTRLDGHTHEHRGELATVVLEPDVPRVSLVYQSTLKVRNNGDYLDETIITEKKPIQW